MVCLRRPYPLKCFVPNIVAKFLILDFFSALGYIAARIRATTKNTGTKGVVFAHNSGTASWRAFRKFSTENYGESSR